MPVEVQIMRLLGGAPETRITMTVEGAEATVTVQHPYDTTLGTSRHHQAARIQCAVADTRLAIPVAQALGLAADLARGLDERWEALGGDLHHEDVPVYMKDERVSRVEDGETGVIVSMKESEAGIRIYRLLMDTTEDPEDNVAESDLRLVGLARHYASRDPRSSEPSIDFNRNP